MKKIPGLDSILLVDDDEITNLIHKRIIESSGIDVQVNIAHTGKEAIDYLLGNGQESYIKTGIIFLDINMPGMNGWEFLEVYHDLPEANKVKAVIVMLTTSIDPKDRHLAQDNPDVEKFVNKTLTHEQLMEIVDTHFKS